MVSDDRLDVAGDRPGEIPLACSLTASELSVRGEENASLFAHAEGAEELPDGYRFTFPAEADFAPDLLQFVLAERACCPFFTFELTFPSPHQAIYLTVRGREGVKEIVRASVAATVNGERYARQESAEASASC
jgi:hypothetical protein